MGNENSSFVAILGAAGLAVGLALQGSLANFAGCALVLGFKPFKVGNPITAQGFTGNLEGIQIFNTVLVTLDNKTIILPNGLDKIRTSHKNVVESCPHALKNCTHDLLVTKLTENAIFFDFGV